MLAVIVLLLLSGAVSAGGQAIHAGITVTPAAAESAGVAADAAGFQAGLQRLFDIRYGSFVTLAFDAGTDTSAAPADAAARIVLGLSGGVVTVSTDLTRKQATRSLVSTVPAGSPASLLATISGDLAFLYFASLGFSCPASFSAAAACRLRIDGRAGLPDGMERRGSRTDRVCLVGR